MRLGLLKPDGGIDDVLALKTTDFLDRRLQTFVNRSGLTSTIGQARQLITHGHVRIRGRKVTAPSYLVRAEEEKDITLVNPDIITPKKSSKKVKEAEPVG